MVVNGSILVPKSSKNFVCNYCDYFTCRKSQLERHLSTDKHKKKQNDSKMVTNDSDLVPKSSRGFKCECGRIYKYDSGYYRHKKICNKNSEKEKNNDNDKLIMSLIKQNSELLELVKNGLNNTICNNTTNNTTNNSFNLNFFLNETCKDAMNISDFINSIKLNLEDLENTGRKGYIEGISNIFLKNLNSLEHHMRPLHCSDVKREVLYIKQNDEWTKETEDKPILTNVIKTIANENIKQIKIWREKYPDCIEADSKKNNLYLKIVSNSMNGLTEEEGKKNINKIISNLAKESIIYKNC
jgi:hypothetical protein